VTTSESPRKSSLSVKSLILLYGSVTLLFGGFYFFADLQMARNSTDALVKKALKGIKAPLTVKSLSKWQKTVLLRVEDPSFYKHNGVDWSTPGAGATTMTQSLVKWMYFRKFTPGFAKIKQTLIARFALHPKVSKDKQLGLFLNIAYLGHHKDKAVRGFAQASKLYFKKKFKDLSKREYLALVAMLIAPQRTHILRHKAANAERVKRIQKLLSGKCKPAGWRDVTYEACK
jgi:membrane carboxypeptidase/penicillin-binding protein